LILVIDCAKTSARCLAGGGPNKLSGGSFMELTAADFENGDFFTVCRRPLRWSSSEELEDELILNDLD
jgi:hypothetical protein